MIYTENRTTGVQTPVFPISDVVLEKDITGLFQVTASFLRNDNDEGFSELTNENYIYVNDVKFRIKQVKRNSKGNKKDVLAQNVYLDLVWNQRKEQISYNFNGDNLRIYVDFALRGSSYTYSFGPGVDEDEVSFLAEFGFDNSIALLNRVCETYKLYINVISTTHLRFDRLKNNPADALLFSYGDNIEVLNESVRTDNLRTIIEATGFEGRKVSYVAPSAITWGYREAEPIENEAWLNNNQLLTACENAIMSDPEIEIDVDIAEMLNGNIGDYVYLMHIPMGFDAYVNIIGTTQHYNVKTRELKTVAVKVGNAVRGTLTDAFVKMNKNVKEVNRKASNLTRNVNVMSANVDNINNIAPYAYNESLRQSSNQLQNENQMDFLSNEIQRLSQEVLRLSQNK